MKTWTLPTNWVELPRERFLQPNAQGRYSVPLRVDEPAGLPRTSHPVTSGVPIPEGALKDGGAGRVLDENGRELPLQTQALAKWPDGSVKWLLLDFQADLKPNESRKMTLEFGPGVSSSVQHPSPVTLRESDDLIEVASDSFKFQISDFRLPRALRPVFSARSLDGSRDGIYTGKVEDLRVEESGPLRAVVRVAGWHYRQDGRKSMPWIIRFTAWAGLPVIGVQHTFILSDDPLTTFWRGIGLQFPGDEWDTLLELSDGLALTRNPEGTRGVLVRDHAKLLPKENHFDEKTKTLSVYFWPLHGEEMDLRSVLVRQPPDFQEWKTKYPEMFERLEGGPMTPQEALDFFTGKKPCTAMGDWRARTGKGVARTHDVFIATAQDAAECETLLRPFDKPLFAACPPSYYAMTGALGHFHPRDDTNFPEIESAIDTHLGWLYRHQHEWQNWDNFWDRGDYLGVYDVRRGEWWKYDDGMRGWNNGEVNTDHGPFLQFLRTGDRRHLDFAGAIARHRMDCDQCHFEDDHPAFVGGIHRHHMTEHWTGLIDGGHQWNDGMINLYYLFGMRRALECAVELAEFALRDGVPFAVNRADTSRETNNCLRILARTFEATGDKRYREAADAIARAYLASFDEHGTELPLEQSLARLKKEFSGSKWENLPEIAEYNWHGHAGYQYIGYLAPAARYAEAMCRTPATCELARRIDIFAGSIQGDAGQFYGERYLETGDAKYLIPLIRNLPAALPVPIPLDGKGDQPGSYGDARLDYLYGVPYVLAALYKARNELHRFRPKPSAEIKGYRAETTTPLTLSSPPRGEAIPEKSLDHAREFPLPLGERTKVRGIFATIDLGAIANKDPRRNPFGRPMSDDDAKLLPDLKSNHVGFQPSKGNQLIREGYLPLTAHQMYPSTANVVTPNQFALAGLPYGAEVTWGGVPYRFIDPEANHGRAIVVLGANESVTIPIRKKGVHLHILGHVHGRKESRRISQFSQVVVGWYELKYEDGRVEKIELINGLHFDSVFGHAYASGLEHVANFDWLHVYANLTDDQSHLNKMVLRLRRDVRLESLTFRSTTEDWGLLLAAVTIELIEATGSPGTVTQMDVTSALADQFGMETINLADMKIPPDVVAAVPRHLALRYQIVPVYKHQNTLVVAISDPLTEVETLDSLRHILKCNLEGVVAAKDDLQEAVERYYGRGEKAVDVSASEPAVPVTHPRSSEIIWSDLPGWLDVKKRREADDHAMKLFAPCRVEIPASDGLYEVQLVVSGDPEGCSRIRVENNGRQVLADYCLGGGGHGETVKFAAEAREGKLTLDLIPGQNYATGSLFPEKGFTGQYGARWSPKGNFTRIESIRSHPFDTSIVWHSAPSAGIHYGWLLPGASAETLHGLIVDHEDADGNSATTMKWKAGGFRADIANGRYKVIVHHSTYAPLNTVVIDLFANGKEVCREREVAEEVFEFEADVTDGYLQIEWRQPRTHSRVPRYAIRGIVLERLD